MKIGVTCYPTVGGSGILATRLGVELAKRGHEIHFITYERPFAIRGLDYENVYMHHVDVVEYPLFKYPPYTVALGTSMLEIVKQESLDLLHVHYAIPHSTAALLAREATGIPYIVTLHGSDVTILGSDPAYLGINTLSVERADAITAVSRFMAREAYERLGIRNEIDVIPNFVDVDLYKPAPCRVIERDLEKDLIVTHISNFRPVKRIEDLIYAMKIVVKESPNTKLMLVGDGPERHKIEKLVKELDVKNNVNLTGYRNDVANLLKCSDILVLCSATESAPLTLLEGLSSGVPAVATKVGGIPEIIQDGTNGFLVEPKNPELIAEKILSLHDDALRLKLGVMARKTILENFTIDNVIKQYGTVYEKVLSTS